MREIDAQLAGEMSGHIFFKERWFGFDDCLYAAVRLLELLACDPLERTPTEVFAALPNRQNTPEILIDMAECENYSFIEQLIAEAKFTGAQVTTVDGIRAEYPNGWGLVRASNTVPSISLRFEADTAEDLHDIQQQFKQQMLQVKPTLTLDF
jgi:phosphomannomutase/phosphoglucomutase